MSRRTTPPEGSNHVSTVYRQHRSQYGAIGVPTRGKLPRPSITSRAHCARSYHLPNLGRGHKLRTAPRRPSGKSPGNHGHCWHAYGSPACAALTFALYCLCSSRAGCLISNAPSCYLAAGWFPARRVFHPIESGTPRGSVFCSTFTARDVPHTSHTPNQTN